VYLARCFHPARALSRLRLTPPFVGDLIMMRERTARRRRPCGVSSPSASICVDIQRRDRLRLRNASMWSVTVER
jgi:hypothetical protein